MSGVILLIPRAAEISEFEVSIMESIVKETLENLKKNNMEAYYADKKEDVLDIVKGLLKKGETITSGGSVTLKECGVMELLRCGDYNFLDRYKEGLTGEEREKIYRDAFFADTYFMSSNAIIKSGVLYNVDGNANRVAALLYGPKSVVVIAGKNKIVDNFDDAVKRLKTIAAPLNTKRLSCPSYCEKKGECLYPDSGAAEPFAGCRGEGRICSNYVMCAYQRNKNRIKVIIVGEDLGY